MIALSSWAAQRGSAIAQLSGLRRLEGGDAELSRRRSRATTPRTASSPTSSRPGIVQTPMSEISAVARGGIDAVNAALAMGEMVPPEEVAELVAFLATRHAAAT